MVDDIRWSKQTARDGSRGCALLVAVRDNRIVQVKGDPEGFLNRGYMCVKGSPHRIV